MSREISLVSLLPKPETILSLEPEELAGPLLIHLKSLPERDGRLNRYNYFQDPRVTFSDFALHQEEVADAFLAAWVWLEREGLLLPRVGAGHSDWVKISPRGRRMASAADVDAYRRAGLLPRAFIHSAIAGSVLPLFLRGDYEAAILVAFKEVEVSVRKAAGLPDSEYGVELMRAAFDEKNGPLRDPGALAGERVALSNLFAGAIGSLKNPVSHRRVEVADTREAVELIILASHLLRIVDARTK